MQRALWALALAALSAALSSGCNRNGAPATPAAPAAEERVLRIYNWSDYIGFHTIADFEHATGIKVIYDLFDSNETLEAKLLVGDSGYDIVSTSEAYYSRQIRAGLYEPLNKAATAELEESGSAGPGGAIQGRPRQPLRRARTCTRSTASPTTSPSFASACRRRRSQAWTCCSNPLSSPSSPTAA